MSKQDSEVSEFHSALMEASKIKPLNGRDDWAEWDEKLECQLGMIDLYIALTDPTIEPDTRTKSHEKWAANQRKLASLLLNITGPHAKSLIKDRTKTASQQYQILKEAYNIRTTPTIYTFFSLIGKITKFEISNYKDLQEYGEEFIKARDKLIALGQPVPAVFLLYKFLDGLDESCQAWKNEFLSRDFAKDVTCSGVTTRKMVFPEVEEIIKELMDQDDSMGKSADTNSNTSPYFGAKGPIQQENHQKPESSSAQNQTNSAKTCSHCGGPHTNQQCWFLHPTIAPDTWKARHSTPQVLKSSLEKHRKRSQNTGNHKLDFKNPFATHPVITTRSNVKVDAWYLSKTSPIHMTHDRSLYFTQPLDDQSHHVTITTGVSITTQGAGTVSLKKLLNGNPMSQLLLNVHYAPAIKSNVLSLPVLHAKGFTVRVMLGITQVLDNEGNVVLEAKREGNLSLLLQPR